MKKGFIFGFVAAVVIIGIVIGAFMLGKSSASNDDKTVDEQTTTVKNDDADEKKDSSENEQKETSVTKNDEETDESSNDGEISNGYITRVVAGENWEEGKKKCYKFEVYVKNTDKEPREIKSVVIDNIPEGSELGDAWNGQLEIKGSKIKAVFMDYNKEVATDAESSFGFIIRVPVEFDISNSKIIAK